MREPAMTHAALRRAAENGIITREQLEALLADPDQSTAPEEPIEAAEAFNAITVAYYVGASVVLFGFGWFLFDRWRALGPGGVLVVALLYTTLFLGTAFLLRRNRFTFAAAVATLLAVSMTPLITWAVLKLSGVWPDKAYSYCAWDEPWQLGCRGKWMIVELTTILAALIALRTVRYAVLMKPIAISLLLLTVHIVESLFGYRFDSTAAGWAVITSASLMLSLAYAIDQRNATDQDYAFWLYLPGLIAAFIGLMLIWSFDRSLRHALFPIALVTMGVAVYLRRKLFLLFGAVWLTWYLGYLAFDVFRKVVALPVILATVGLIVILGAVWAQRHYPRLVARVRGDAGGRPALPLGHVIFAAPAVLALLMIPLATDRDREILAQQRHQQRVWATRAARERRAMPPAIATDAVKPERAVAPRPARPR